MNIKLVRKDFEILNHNFNGKRLVYLDNAATTHKPRQVIRALIDYYEKYNANVHRGIYELSLKSSELYDHAHRVVSKFINAYSENEIVFVKNATEALNLASAIIPIAKDESIVSTISEHHSNLIPWQIRAKASNVRLNFLGIDKDYRVDEEEVKTKVTKKTKILAIQHGSNVSGAINDIKHIIKIAKDINPDIITVVDGAQSAPHIRIDIRKLGCDFFAFTGHKMLGPTGIGVLYGREDLLKNFKTFIVGGGTIKNVELYNTVFADPPKKYEAGTPNIAGAIGLCEAINYLNSIGFDEIMDYEESLARYFINRFNNLSHDIRLIGPNSAKNRLALFSITHKTINCYDLAMFINSNPNIMFALRSGYHCAQPFFNYLKVKGALRASLYIYNTKEEISLFFEELDKALIILENKIKNKSLT